MIDYHIHTPLCNHATGSMVEMIQAAIDAGLQEICFLDHLIPCGRGSSHSMSAAEVPFYFQAIQVMKQKFQDRIIVRAGLEVDFQPERMDEILDITGRFAFDVIGGAVHFVNGINIASRREASGRPVNDESLVGHYFELIDRMLDYDYFDIVCHLDVIRKTGRSIPSHFEPQIEAILRKISKKNRVMEINTGGMDHPAGSFYPEQALFRKCLDHGIQVTLGSDSHAPEEVGRYSNSALSQLLKAGYSEVVTFEKRHMIKKAIECEHVSGK